MGNIPAISIFYAHVIMALKTASLAKVKAGITNYTNIRVENLGHSIWPAIIFHLQISIMNEWPPLQQFFSPQK